jgi:hypothetical protein
MHSSADNPPGGLISFGLGTLRWEPVRCSEVFDSLARRLFGHKQKTAGSPIARMKRYLHYWIWDGVHDPVVLESSLKDTFGPERRLFGTPQEHISDCKVAVITASISDATPFILSNYNGMLPKAQFRGMNSMREAPFSANLLQPINC